MKKPRFTVAALAGLTALLALASCIVIPSGPASPYGPGGMMGPGGMTGPGMGGMGPGMMPGGPYAPDARPITIDQAAEAVKLYLNAYGPNLALKEIMEFELNLYAEIEETDTRVHAMELLVDRYTGQVYPEMGPNMMWNTKYGMMGRRYAPPGAAMPVTPDKAATLAQQYLNANLPGVTVAAADAFYGYHTLHTLKNGQVEGMLSVNGYTGAVWYHTWHGRFLGMKEYH